MEIIQHFQMVIKEMKIRENAGKDIIKDIIQGNFP